VDCNAALSLFVPGLFEHFISCLQSDPKGYQQVTADRALCNLGYHSDPFRTAPRQLARKHTALPQLKGKAGDVFKAKYRLSTLWGTRKLAFSHIYPRLCTS